MFMICSNFMKKSLRFWERHALTPCPLDHNRIDQKEKTNNQPIVVAVRSSRALTKFIYTIFIKTWTKIVFTAYGTSAD